VCGPLCRGEHPPLLEVGADTEGTLSRAGDDEHPDVVSMSKSIARRQQLLCELTTYGVERLGSVQGKRGNVTFGVNSQQHRWRKRSIWLGHDRFPSRNLDSSGTKFAI